MCIRDRFCAVIYSEFVFCNFSSRFVILLSFFGMKKPTKNTPKTIIIHTADDTFINSGDKSFDRLSQYANLIFLLFVGCSSMITSITVSYTHLDVYKRQVVVTHRE